jgi:hypothetical protein
MFNFTLKNIMFDWCNLIVSIIWEITRIIFLQNYNWLFVKGIENFRMMNKFTYNWKT